MAVGVTRRCLKQPVGTGPPTQSPPIRDLDQFSRPQFRQRPLGRRRRAPHSSRKVRDTGAGNSVGFRIPPKHDPCQRRPAGQPTHSDVHEGVDARESAGLVTALVIWRFGRAACLVGFVWSLLSKSSSVAEDCGLWRLRRPLEGFRSRHRGQDSSGRQRGVFGAYWRHRASPASSPCP
jgi:hypothetical protein